MITITQKLNVCPESEQLLLTKGINYLKIIRGFKGCQSFQLMKNIEDNGIYHFQSVWKTLEGAINFFKNGLSFDLDPNWNIQDHTTRLDCQSVNEFFSDDLPGKVKNGESLLLRLNQLKLTGLSVRKKPVQKYASSHLTDLQIDQFLDSIKSHMAEFEPYRRKDITLVKFAEEVGLHSHHVSRVINEKVNQNFSDFVNSYRVELAKNLLSQDLLQRYTISGIGNEAGFNSRSAFYNAFRKFTGQSPGEFIKNRISARVA